MDESKNLNKESYNKIAEQWAEDRSRISVSKLVVDFSQKIKQNGNILDIGCGTGYPIAKYLCDKGFFVTGIDISENMLKKAGEQEINNPAAEQRGMLFSRGIGLGFNTFITAPEGRGIKPSPRIKNANFYLCDFFEFEPIEKYDGIIAFDSFFHFPKEKQEGIYKKVSDWLNIDGYLLFTHGKEEGETKGSMFGETFYYSALNTEKVHELLLQNGFEIELSIENYKENDTERDLVIVAKKRR
ncbi:MAG: class I SAM-dependent methyltransferase [Treponema sp.]|jgi:predicted TPR repeat methyltransferase|nr:class I SAM-dependent methyltransferase [Treponema sp.]